MYHGLPNGENPSQAEKLKGAIGMGAGLGCANPSSGAPDRFLILDAMRLGSVDLHAGGLYGGNVNLLSVAMKSPGGSGAL